MKQTKIRIISLILACALTLPAFTACADENTETEKQDKLISINNGTLEELMTLPGVGESKAKNIIEYRENNKFEKIEDIMNVSGIGEAAYSKIKDLIKL